MKWWRKAAEQGDALAFSNFGTCYANGIGVEKDAVESFAWVNIAAVNDPKAATIRDQLKESLTPEVISAGQKRSKELREQIDAKVKAGNENRLGRLFPPLPPGPSGTLRSKNAGEAFQSVSPAWSMPFTSL